MKSSMGLGSKQGPVSQVVSTSSSTRSILNSRIGSVTAPISRVTRATTRAGLNLNQLSSVSANGSQKTLARGIPDIPKNGSPHGTRRIPGQVATRNVGIRESVFRKPLPINPISNPSSKGEKNISVASRSRLASSVLPSSDKHLTTTNAATKPRNLETTSSPVTIRKAASALGVHTMGVTYRSNASRTQRNVQTEEGQPFADIGKGGVTGSRSVDSLSNGEGLKGAKSQSSCISPPPIGEEELRVLYEKIAKLKGDLDIRDKEVTKLREENNSLVAKPAASELPDESYSLENSSFYISGIQPEKEGAGDNQSSIATNEQTKELASLKLELKELKEKYRQLENKYEGQQLANVRMSKEYEQMESDYTHWKQTFFELKDIYDEEMERINEDRKEWKIFQDDLLTVVRAANDYKTDAQEKWEAIEVENSKLREKICVLEANSKSSSEISSLRRRTPDSPFPLLSQSKSNTRDVTDVIEEIERNDLSTSTVSSKGEEENTPRVPVYGNNKENCASNDEYNNQLNLDTRAPSDKRVNAPGLISTKKLEKGNGSLDQDDDPLVSIMKATGSKRNALLRWCQSRTAGYKHVDITNFSTSWSNGMAFCALLHSYIPEHIPYNSLKPENPEENFNFVFKAAETVGISTTLNVDEMISQPSWQVVMNYVKDIYKNLGSCDSN